MTVDDVLDSRSADDESVDCGYEPELKRTLGPFQVFAISFAFISVAVGVFATYDAVLQTAGPVGIWLWVVSAVGQTLVALVVAQFSARIALSGSSYQWASRLANPKIGWFGGWLSFWFLATGAVAMANAPGEALMQLIIGGTILPALIYGATVVLYLSVRKRLDSKEGAFSLGRFELPVAYAALMWVALAIFALLSPPDAVVPGLVVLGLIVAGGIYFASMLLVNREVLETEPGEPGAF